MALKEHQAQQQLAATTVGGAAGQRLRGCSDNDDEDDNRDHDEDELVLVTANNLCNAFRLTFHAPLVPTLLSDNAGGGQQLLPSTVIMRRHWDAIDTFLLLCKQFKLWHCKSSISIDIKCGVRGMTTSALMSRPAATTTSASTYRFTYASGKYTFDIVHNIDDTKEGGEGEGGK